MPAFIRTPADEARWSKAKEAANKQHSEGEGDRYWGLVNHIYQNMKKEELAKSGPEAIAQRIQFIRDLLKSSPDVYGNNPELLDKILNTLAKARGDDDEEHDQQDYALDPEDLEGLSVKDDPFEDEGDEADMWLREHGGKEVPESAKASGDDEKEAPASKEVKSSKSGYTEWKPHGEYSKDQQAKMKELVDSGYSDREAERMVGAHKGPKDFQSALKHTVKPSQPSSKHLGELKELASHWLDRAERHSKVNADPEKNPQKFAAGKMLQAHEAHSKDFNKDYNEFLGSDTLKDKKGLERHKAIQAWKKDWKDKNPEYHGNIGNVSESQKHYKEAGEARKKNVDEALAHIMTGGHTPDAMSAQEAAQHVGGTKDDEGYSATTIKDPSASFAEKNKGFINMKQQQQQPAAAPAKPKQDPMVIIRRRASPEQMDRFTRVQAARASQGVGKKPEGVE